VVSKEKKKKEQEKTKKKRGTLRETGEKVLNILPWINLFVILVPLSLTVLQKRGKRKKDVKIVSICKK